MQVKELAEKLKAEGNRFGSWTSATNPKEIEKFVTNYWEALARVALEYVEERERKPEEPIIIEGPLSPDNQLY